MCLTKWSFRHLGRAALWRLVDRGLYRPRQSRSGSHHCDWLVLRLVAHSETGSRVQAGCRPAGDNGKPRPIMNAGLRPVSAATTADTETSSLRLRENLQPFRPEFLFQGRQPQNIICRFGAAFGAETGLLIPCFRVLIPSHEIQLLDADR